MNSEELEQSLRSEFESYLKSVFVEIREETAEFQKKIEAEFEEQRSHLDLAFQAFSARFDTEHQFHTWLYTPSFALGGLKPFDLLSDSYGKEMVMTELHKIDEGIFV